MMCFLPHPLRHPGRCSNCRIKWILILITASGSEQTQCFDTEAEARWIYDAVLTRKCWAGIRYDRAILVRPCGPSLDTEVINNG